MAREVQRRPGRALLTLLGITLALATVVATRLTTGAVRRAYRELFEGVTGGAALDVNAPGLAAFDPGRAAGLRSAPGVRAVVPRIRGAAGVVGADGGASTPLLGVDPARAAADWRLRQGRLPAGDEALLDAGLAANLGVEPGRPFRLWTPSGSVSLVLAGTIEPRGSVGAGGLLVVPLETARHLLGLPPGHVNALRVELEDGADGRRVADELARRLPPGLTVHPPGGHGELARSTLMAAEQGLSALGALAVVASAFVIFNTFLLNLAERCGQLALLKTLGATRGQVLRLLLDEALLLGLAGTAAGCALGTGLAFLLLGAMGRFLGVCLAGPRPTPGPYLLAGLLGPATALAAACVPSWQASRRPALDWLLPRRGPGGEVSPRWLSVAGLALLAAGTGPALGLCRGWFTAAAGRALLPGTLAMLLGGGALAFPLLLGPALALLRACPLGLAAELPLRQLDRQRTRAGLGAGVLFLALAVGVSFGQSLRGIVHDLRGWYGRSVVADFLVRASMPDTTFTLATALPDALADGLAALPGAAGVDRLAFVPAEADGREVLVLARTFPAGGRLPLDLRGGDAGEVLRGLRRGEAVLAMGLAAQLGRRPGDRFELLTPRGPVPLRVAGTAAEFAGGGSALYLEWGAARRLLDVPGPHVLLVTARPGAAAELSAALVEFCHRRRLLLQSNAELRGLIDRLLARVTGAVWALLALVLVVASLGVVNTLQMNVQEQGRAFGVLRALGMKRGQVARLVLAQALFLAGLSLPPGVVAGLALARVISRSSACWAGVPISFRPDAGLLLGACAIALASAVVAALLPGRYARRVSSARALA
jgi:putative ABC transport system permease protein